MSVLWWVVVVLLVLGAVELVAWALATRRLEETRHPGDFRRVSVVNPAGPVAVHGGQVGEALVRRKMRYFLVEPRVTEDSVGDTLTVRGPRRWIPWPSMVDLEVFVPPDAEVEAISSAGGVEVSGVTGSVVAHSSAGGVQVDDVHGPLRARSSAGSVTVHDSGPQVEAVTSAGRVSITFAEPPVDVLARSSAGPVEVLLPDEVYAVQARSSAGRVEVGVRTDPASPRAVVATSSAGQVRVVPAQRRPSP